jgi:hypothetical protein
VNFEQRVRFVVMSSTAYNHLVTGRIAELRAASAWRPPTSAPSLRVLEVRAPRAIESLHAHERRDLERLLGPKLLLTLLADAEKDVQVVTLVDDAGARAAVIYAWGYGGSYTFDAQGKLLAFGSQHDVEVWNHAQRLLFWSLDQALSHTSLSIPSVTFPWWDEGLWEELEEGEDRGDPGLARLRG